MPCLRNLARERPADLAAPGLFLEVGEIELRHGPEQADVHGADLTHVHRVEADATELQLIGNDRLDQLLRQEHELGPEASLTQAGKKGLVSW
jgi:hypothetical protein